MNSNEAAADVLMHKFKIGQTVYLERSLAVPGRKDDRMGVPAQFIGTSLCRFVPIADIRTGRRYFRRSSTGSLAMLLAILHRA